METTKQIEIGPAFRWGWDTFTKDFWYFLLLFLLVIFLPNLVIRYKANNFFFNFVSLFISTWMACGITRILLDYYRGKKDEMSTIFTYVKPYWNVLLATIFLGILIFVGLIFFIIPGVYLAIKYQFTINLIIDKDMDILDSMKKSAEMSEGIKMDLFLFGLTTMGVVILGFIALGIGIFIAIPVVYLAYTYLYMNVLGEKSKDIIPTPAMPTPPTDK